MAHQAVAYPGFGGMKRLGVFLLPPGWDARPSQGYNNYYSPELNSLVFIYIHLGGERHCESEVSCPKTQSPARAQTWTARSGYECTNHETTVPPTELVICGINEAEILID